MSPELRIGQLVMINEFDDSVGGVIHFYYGTGVIEAVDRFDKTCRIKFDDSKQWVSHKYIIPMEDQL